MNATEMAGGVIEEQIQAGASGLNKIDKSQERYETSRGFLIFRQRSRAAAAMYDRAIDPKSGRQRARSNIEKTMPLSRSPLTSPFSYVTLGL